MNRLNTDMKNEIINWLNPIYLAFSLIYVSKEFNKLSIRKLTILEYLPGKYETIIYELSHLNTKNISIDRFLEFGVTVTEIFKYMPYYSSMYNNIDLLKYLNEVERYNYPTENHIFEESFTSIDTLFIAASGSFECMKYILEEIEKNTTGKSHNILLQCNKDNNQCNGKCTRTHSYQTIYSCAITNGSLECLKYLLENGYSCIGNLLYTEELSQSDEYVLECLKYASRNSGNKSFHYKNETKFGTRDSLGTYLWDESVLECLKYAHENRDNFGTSGTCLWDKHTCSYASLSGSLECLKYAHENGAPLNGLACAYAAQSNSLECLKYAHENGASWNEWTCANAAKSGSLECLKYLHENIDKLGTSDACPWNEDTCIEAARSGSLECLKYAHENGCPWNAQTCDTAAGSGSLECLKYAHENGCPWDELTCIEAAQSNSLECLKYAHEYVNELGIKDPCPWDEWTCRYAARYNSLECLKYAHENGAPWNEETCIAAIKHNSIECIKYMVECIDEFEFSDLKVKRELMKISREV